MTRWARVLLLVLVLAGVAEAAAERPWAWLGVRIRDLSEQEMDAIAALDRGERIGPDPATFALT